MNDRPVVATFDCYGTLVDWEGGLGNFLYAFALRNGWTMATRCAVAGK